MTLGRPVLLAIALLATAATVPARSGAAVARAGRPGQALQPAAETLLVRLRGNQVASAGWLDSLDFVHTVRELPAIRTAVARVVRGSRAEARARLLADPRVESVDYDAPLHADRVPNDALYPRQWALQMIQAPFAWELATGSANVVVGVLDSGVDLTHPDLAAHVLSSGCNLIADRACSADGSGTPPQDQDGHGSQVAGIIAAVSDNHTGVAGVTWNASLLPVKVTTAQGVVGQEPVGSESDFITGLLWAVDHGAVVLNFSFSEDCGAPESAAMRNALAHAWNQGALLVASAGNDGGCSQGVFPAADPHVLAVAATDMNDRPLVGDKGSNFGPWVRVAAPGEHIQTTFSGGQYSFFSGTSAAAPEVAGLAALLFSVPGATNASVLSWILSTSDLPDGWNPAYGRGRINAYRAVSLAVRGVDPHGPPPPAVNVHLLRGWNNLLYLGPTRPVDTALATIRGKYGSVYAWDPLRGVWHTFLPGQAVASDLELLEERGAYWIYVPSDVDLVVSPTGTGPPPQRTLAPGWNNLALPAGPWPATLQRFSGRVSSIFAWNPAASTWKGFFATAQSVSDLEASMADTAYWVFAPARMTVRFER